MAMPTDAHLNLAAVCNVQEKLHQLLKHYFLGVVHAPVVFLQLTKSLESLSHTLQRVLDEKENPVSKIFREENRAASKVLLDIGLRGAEGVLVNLEAALKVLKVACVREQSEKWWVGFAQQLRNTGGDKSLQALGETVGYHRWCIDLILRVLRKNNAENIIKCTRYVPQHLDRLLDSKIVTSDSHGRSGASIRSKFVDAAEHQGDAFTAEFALEAAIRMAMYWSYKAIVGLENVATLKTVSSEGYLNMLKSSWIIQRIREDSRLEGALIELRAVLGLVSMEIMTMFKIFLEAKIDSPELETLTKYADFRILLDDFDAVDLVTSSSPSGIPRHTPFQKNSLPVLTEENTPYIGFSQGTPDISQHPAYRNPPRARAASDTMYYLEAGRRRQSSAIPAPWRSSSATYVDEVYPTDSPTLGSAAFNSKIVVPENTNIRSPSSLPPLITQVTEQDGLRWESPNEVSGRPRGSSAGSGGSWSRNIFGLEVSGEVVNCGVRPGEDEVMREAFKHMNILASDSYEFSARWDESLVRLFRNSTGDLRILTLREGSADQRFVPLKDAELIPHYAHASQNLPVIFLRKTLPTETRSTGTRRSSTSSSSTGGESMALASLCYKFKSLVDMFNFQMAFLGESVEADVSVKFLRYKRGLLDTDHETSASRVQLWKEVWVRNSDVTAGGRVKGTLKVMNTRMVIYSETGVFCLFVTDDVCLDRRPKTKTLRIKPSAHKTFNNPSSIRVCPLGAAAGFRLDMKGLREEDVESWEEWRWAEIEFAGDEAMGNFYEDFECALQNRRKDRKWVEELRRMAADGVKRRI